MTGTWQLPYAIAGGPARFGAGDPQRNVTIELPHGTPPEEGRAAALEELKRRYPPK